MDEQYPQSNIHPTPGRSGGKTWLWIVLVIVLIVAAAGGVYYWQQQQAKKQKAELQSQIDALKKQVSDAEQKAKEAEAANADETANWKSYTITADKLSFKYPTSWRLTTTKDGYASLMSPNKFMVSFATGQGLGGACIDDCPAHNVQNQVLAELSYYTAPLYAVVNGLKDTSKYGEKTIQYNVITEKTCYYNICYGYTGKNSKVPIIITGQFVESVGGKAVYVEPAKFVSDPDVKTSISILKTLSY